MGLDMYLWKETYVGDLGTVFEMTARGATNTLHIDPTQVFAVRERFGYWRKANAIHKYFVDYVQDGNDDCGTYEVSREQLEELYSLVKDTLAHPEQADGLLPTEAGFFFGGTEYGEYYFEQLQYTKELLEKALDLMDKDARVSFVYTSSW